MTRDGLPLVEANPKTIDTGIAFEPLIEGLVPEVEEREAATLAGYTWREWHGTLSYDERVDGVAYYRVRKLIELNQADAARRFEERASKRK